MKHLLLSIFLFTSTLIGTNIKHLANTSSLESESLPVIVKSNYDLIKEAILKKKSITCDYKGYSRKMSPHVLGTKNGREHALFYQYAGESESDLSLDPSHNWRCIFVDQIENLTINDDEFYTFKNHSQRQTCVDIIDVEISY